MKEASEARMLIQELAVMANMSACLHPGDVYRRMQRRGEVDFDKCPRMRPGAFIERLSSEQRDILKSLTAEDMEGVIPLVDNEPTPWSKPTIWKLWK